MVTKMTSKNQVTIPKKIIAQAGLTSLKEDERYFDVDVKDHWIILKPVRLIVEERIPDKQWEKFEAQASQIESGDKVFNSSTKATAFLKKRMKTK